MRYIAKFFTLLLSNILSLSALALTVLCGFYFFYAPQLPDSRDLHQIELQVPLRIYSHDNQLIAEYGAKRRRPVNFAQIPPRLRQAFIAIEDARYYEHQGIDLKGVARALHNLVQTGRFSQGASTITMQLARNAFLGREKTLERKLKETLLAFKLERTLSKNEILELYLNKIYLGNRAYGIAAAAQIYYGKENLEELSLAQMAMLAGLPKAPSRYNPIANPERAMTRRDYILKRMLILGYINRTEYEQAFLEDNTASLYKPTIAAHAPYMAEMVRAAIVKQYQSNAYTQGLHVYTTLDANIQQHTVNALRNSLIAYDQRHGYRGPEDRINLSEYPNQEDRLDKLADYRTIADMQAALVINANNQQAELLTLNAAMNGQTVRLGLTDIDWAKPFISTDRQGSKPRSVSRVLRPGDIVRLRKTPPSTTEQNHDANTAGNWQLTQIPDVNGALLVMDPQNGAVRSIVGGFDYKHSKFNRATQAMRQPGSSFKPIVYSAALESGFTPASIINDAPITVPGKDWQPKNFGGKYVGPTTIAEALAKSRNLVAIRLLRNAGIPHTIDYAMRFGYERKNLPPNLTLALGTGLTTPLKMATAYSAFANGGFKVGAHFINRIEDSTGQVLFDAANETTHVCGDQLSHCSIPVSDAETRAARLVPTAPRIMQPKTHSQMISMLQGVTQFGTAAYAGKTLKRKDIAGKTGTTNDQKDSWFCGFTPEYVAVAWAGFDDMAELGKKETSTKIAVPMWTELMQAVLRERPEKPWPTYKPLLQQAAVDNNDGTTEPLATDTTFNLSANDSSSESDNIGFSTSSVSDEAIAIDPKPVTPQSQHPIQENTALTQTVLPETQNESVEIPEQIF